MITKTFADLAATNMKYRNDPRYTAMMLNRPAKKRRAFNIGNGIFFEYWSTHEWEFTMMNPEIDRHEWMKVVNEVMRAIRGMNPTPDKVNRIVKFATKSFAQFL